MKGTFPEMWKAAYETGNESQGVAYSFATDYLAPKKLFPPEI